MQPLPFGSVQLADGDLLRRATRSLERLQNEPYLPAEVYRPADYEWPGDYEGRLLLALIQLGQALGQEPASLAPILDELPAHLNEQGYFGPIRDDGLVDEQQMSGNNWFLSALVALYRWRSEPETLESIRRVVRGLLLPTRGAYAAYPADPAERAQIPEGAAAGSRVDHAIGRWLPSTDVGCAFIALDGASAAYAVLPDDDRAALGALIDEMIARYLAIDVRALSFQTHATLSALRGVLQHYATTGDDALLEAAVERYALYRAHAMTENYANDNWFNRPTWTEPCAVVDALLVTMALWQHTRDAAYLDDAHHIYWNALGHGQRPNGGFGCDTCTAADMGEHAFLAVHSEGVYEATWCCSMRGGAGLAEAVRMGAWQEGDALYLPFYHPGRYEAALASGVLAFSLEASYPDTGGIRLAIEEAPPDVAIPLLLYVPAWAPPLSISLMVNGEVVAPRRAQGMAVVERVWAPGDTVALVFEIGLRRERPLRDAAHHPDVYTLRHGPLILGVENAAGQVELPDAPPRPLGDGRYGIGSGDLTLEPINRLFERSDEEMRASRMQILFRSPRRF